MSTETEAKDLKIGQIAVFRRPKKLSNELTWFGTKNAHEYNDSQIEGKVIKITKKNIKIKQDYNDKVWNYGHEYIIPKEAVAIVPSEKELENYKKRLVYS